MQVQAQIPAGLAAGETFMVQTPTGIVPVQVPPGAYPGQVVLVPAPGAASAPAPMAMGTVVGDAAPADYRPGRPYRVDPMDAQLSNLPLLQGVPVKQQERKLEEIRKGGQLAREWPVFPEKRPLRDAFWAVPFLAAVAVVIFGAVYFSDKVNDVVVTSDERLPPASRMVAVGAAGGVASVIAALAFALLAQRQPACVVWTSLLFGPVLWIAGGLALLFAGAVPAGIFCAALGALLLFCVFSCYRPFIPFMIKIVEAVSGVLRENPMMLAVSVLGSALSVGWSLACGLAIAGAQATFGLDTAETDAEKRERYAFFAVSLLIFIWGLQVFYNMCHVTYCGVYGRWYFKVEQEAPLRKSFRAALTTSFGSICFGSFLIAAIRTIEALVRQARANAQEDGNCLGCIVLLVIECVVACIGDILEYFSEWAYVQCAVRGVSFIQAARITYSMITCSNAEYIVQDLLINTVVNFGALLCGAVGAAVGAGVGFAIHGGNLAVIGAIIGLLAGLLAGGTAVGLLSSGTKTILALWAEDPEPLRAARPELHQDFEQRVLSKMME